MKELQLYLPGSLILMIPQIQIDHIDIVLIFNFRILLEQSIFVLDEQKNQAVIHPVFQTESSIFMKSLRVVNKI